MTQHKDGVIALDGCSILRILRRHGRQLQSCSENLFLNSGALQYTLLTRVVSVGLELFRFCKHGVEDHDRGSSAVKEV